MEFIIVDEERDFASHVANNQKLVVIFGAKWCKNCSKLQDNMQAADNLPNISVCKVDIDESVEIADSFNVSALPHVVYLHRGNVVRNYVGSNIDKVVEYFAELNDLDSSVNVESDALNESSSSNGGAVEPSLFAIQELPETFLLVGKDFRLRELSFQLLNEIGLGSVPIASSQVLEVQQRGLVRKALSEKEADLVATQDLYVYRVPMVSEDGTCSRADMLAKRPFNLAVDAYHMSDEQSWDPLLFVDHPTTRRLSFLNRVVRRLYEVTSADWIGIYRLVLADGEPALLKEAYRGEPSRPVFPVTESFAKKSTNSWVGLTGNVRIIENTRVRDGSISYYECSNKVQSELCAPIFGPMDPQTKLCPVIGIIDLESWNPAHFTPSRVLDVLQVCLDLGEINFGFGAV